MKTTNGELFNNIKPALGKLIQVQLPVKTSFEIAKFTALVQKNVDTVESVRNSLIAKYGETDKIRQVPVITPKSPRWDEFVPEYNELMDIEIELPDTVIVIPQNVNGREVEIEPSVLIALEKFVVMK